MLLSGHQLQLSFVVSFPVKARFNGSKRGMRTGLCVPAARPPSIFCGGESRKPSHIFALKACGPLLQAQDQPTGLYMPAVRIRSFHFPWWPNTDALVVVEAFPSGEQCCFRWVGETSYPLQHPQVCLLLCRYRFLLADVHIPDQFDNVD